MVLKGLGAKGGNRGDFQRRNARDFNDGQSVGCGEGLFRQCVEVASDLVGADSGNVLEEDTDGVGLIRNRFASRQEGTGGFQVPKGQTFRKSFGRLFFVEDGPENRHVHPGWGLDPA